MSDREYVKQYAERDAMAFGKYYGIHIHAMTAEGLHSKSDIAAELAFRDHRIADLEQSLKDKDKRTAACLGAFEGIETDRIAGKTLGEFLAGEIHLNKAEPKPDGSFGFTFSGFAVQIMAEAFAEQFKASGAVNYLELLFIHQDIGPLTVTMQRTEGLSPAQKLAEAEKRETHLQASFDVMAARVAELEHKQSANGVSKLQEEVIKLRIDRVNLEARLQRPVKLPNQEKYYDPLSAYAAINDCADAIRAAGFTVEGE